MDNEISVESVHRPERILTQGISGICIPIFRGTEDGVSSEWRMYIRTLSRRSKVPISSVLNIDGKTIFLETIPPKPNLNETARWSAKSREAWLEGETSIDPADLFQRLRDSIDKYIDFESERQAGYTSVLACWTVLTYLYHAWFSIGYLLVSGPMASGKSTIFRILRELSFRPMATDNVSAAAMFRTLHNYGGTLLFDEAERLRESKSPEVSEINSMLLAGYQRGRGATRLERVGDGFKTVSYNVFGPKAIACINGVSPTLQSRCIEICTQRSSQHSLKPKLSMDSTDWQRLRDDLHVLALDYGDDWIVASNRRDVGTELNGRDFEVWQPLLSIAKFFEDHGVHNLVGVIEKTAQLCLQESLELKTPEADEVILNALADAVRDGIEIEGRKVYRPTNSELLSECERRDGALFRSFTVRMFGGRLRAYGLTTDKSGSRREYRTERSQLRGIQDRYCIDLGFDIPGESVPIVPNVPCEGQGA